MNKFLAKTCPKETIEEHTQCLLERMESLEKLYPNIPFLDWDLLRIACLYHDLGKMNTKFQNKLLYNLNEALLEDNLQDTKEIPHGYLSPAFLPFRKLTKKYRTNREKLSILCQSIYYHHNREKIHDFSIIEKTIEQDLKIQWITFNDLSLDKTEKLYKSYYKYINDNNRFNRTEGNNDNYYEYVITKGILNRLDYAASAHINVEEENLDLTEKTIFSIENKGYKLNELQQYMKLNLDQNNVIRASTGIGKTEAGLIWIGNNKGFFTLPLRVSINAIYDRIRDKTKIGFFNVALLHSDTFREYLKRSNQKNNSIDLDYYEKTKQFSMPLTVCTLDQLLDFIFKCEGYELKLATLSYSKLIIDEIQMYSPDMIGYLIVALKYITEAGGKFTILTATLPSIIVDLLKKENIPFKESKPFYKINSKGKPQLRHKVHVIEDYINIDHIKNNYNNKKVLVIVNTVRKAQEIYDELFKLNLNVPINMFHSRFIKKDRSFKENEIFEMGQRECINTGIWVTTQVVEASLDIDFDVLYTELSEISGLLQRMGRVYRGRALDSDKSNVYIYIGKDKPTSGIRNDDRSIVDIDIFKHSKSIVKTIDGCKLDENKKMELVERVYTEENLKDSNYYKKMKDSLLWAKNIKEYELQKNETRLRNIITYPIIPKCIYESEINYKIINLALQRITEYKDLMKLEKDRKIIQQLYINIQKEKYNIKDYTVDIPGYMFETAKKYNKIYDVIELDKFNNIPIVKINYTYEKGLGKVNKKDEFDEDFQFV